MSYPKLSDVLQNKDEDCQYFRRSFLHVTVEWQFTHFFNESNIFSSNRELLLWKLTSFYILFWSLISHYCRCCFGLKVELVLLSYALLRKVYEFTHCSVTAEVVYISKINLGRNSWNLQKILKIDPWGKTLQGK